MFGQLENSLSKNLTSWFEEKFFPVYIAERKDYLIIEDRRLKGSMFFPALAVMAILAPVSFAFTSLIDSTLVFLGLIAAAFAVVFFLLIGISSYLKRTVVFYKEKDLFEIIEPGIFKTHKETGSISDIKEIKITVNHSTNSDGDDSYTSTSNLIPKKMILDDLRILSLERKTMLNNYETTTRIAYSAAEFLDIPHSEEEINTF